VNDKKVLFNYTVLLNDRIMRITGGLAKGIPLQSGTSKTIRPATDRMREAVFSSLGELITDADCIDLFAGTGAYGLEALSRGAASVHFVEKDGKTVRALSDNLKAVAKSMGVANPIASVQRSDVLKSGLDRRKAAQIIFIDPPYSEWDLLMNPLVKVLPELLFKTPHSRIICEAPGGKDLRIEGMELIRKIGGRKSHDPSVLVLGWID